MRFFQLLFWPITFVIKKMMNGLNKSLSKRSKEDEVTDDELIEMVDTLEEQGLIDEDTQELITNAIDFVDVDAVEIMVHRTDFFAFNIEDDINELLNDPDLLNYSRIPVYEETIDNIIGILPVNLLLKELLDTDQPDINEMLQEPLFVPQTKKLPEVLDLMQRSKIHMAIVTDDHGGTLGIVTMEDILEELVGEIWDETDTIEEEILQVSENEFLADGSMMLNDFLEYFEIEDPELDDYIITVNGWITEILDDYPKVNDSFDYKNYHIIIEETDDLVVSSLKVIRTETKDKDDEEAL